MNEETTDNHRRSTVNLSRTAKITPRQENVMVARLQISCTATTFARAAFADCFGLLPISNLLPSAIFKQTEMLILFSNF